MELNFCIPSLLCNSKIKCIWEQLWDIIVYNYFELQLLHANKGLFLSNPNLFELARPRKVCVLLSVRNIV